MIDISNLSINDLRKLQEEASILIEQKKEQDINDALNAIHDIASNIGFSVQDLLKEWEKHPKKSKRKAVAIRYQNKDHPEETWTGRGKYPRWLVTKLESGEKLEDFLIAE